MNTRRYVRLLAYLPVQCIPLNGEESMAKVTGKTKSLSPGGLGLLLPEPLSLRTKVLVQVLEEEPLPGLVIWRDRPLSTGLATSVPHGVAFDERVDPNRIQRWARHARKRAHPRVRVQFDVEFTGGGKVLQGTCLNLGRGGMFIATMESPRPPGAVTLLRFTMHETSHMLLIPAEVVWVRAEESGPSALTGIGVKFLELTPEEAAVIDSGVGRLLKANSPPHGIVEG